MVANCGEIAQTLIDSDNCDHVAIIWDLMPTWGGKACRKEDVDAITNNLVAANVNLTKTKLICIEPELEGWLIAEGTALTNYKTLLSHPHPVKKFNGSKLSGHSNESKKVITKYLGHKYNDITEAIRIAQNIADYKKIARKHASFARLKNFIEEISK
jgi:hypothetical protein